jgi:hypothetical protein
MSKFNQRFAKPEIETTMTKIMRDNSASVTDLAAVRRQKFPQSSGSRTRLQWMFSSVKYNHTPCQIIPFPVKRTLASGNE